MESTKRSLWLDDDDELFFWYGWPTKGVYLYLQQGFEPAQNVRPGLDEWSCAVVTTTTPGRPLQVLLIQVLKNLFSVMGTKLVYSNLSNDEWYAIRSLAYDKSIVIKKADEWFIDVV